MNMKKVAAFILAVFVSYFAASYRWGDSAHSIGIIKKDGGKAMHATTLESGKDRYMLISTATVIPPYRGDAKVVLEGKPEVDYEIYLSQPVADLGIRNFPEMHNGIIHGLKPMDRIALWVKMRPPHVDPVCGMAIGEDFIKHTYRGREYAFCTPSCLESFRKNPEMYRDMDGVRGRYDLAFYDTKTGNQVLSVPVDFAGKGEGGHGGGHH